METDVKDAISTIAEITDEVESQLTELPLFMQSKDVQRPACETKELIDMIYQIERLIKALNVYVGEGSALRSYREEVRIKLAEYMQDNGLEKLGTDFGSITIDIDPYPSIPDIDEWHAWLRANGHGALVKEGIHPSAQKKLLKELLAEGVSLPSDIKITMKALAKVNLSRTRRNANG